VFINLVAITEKVIVVQDFSVVVIDVYLYKYMGTVLDRLNHEHYAIS
jgi:hypothetical protein